MDVQLLWACLLKRNLPLLNCFYTCIRHHDRFLWVPCGVSVLSHCPMCLLLTQAPCLDTTATEVEKLITVIPPTLSLFKTALAPLQPELFHINFSISLFMLKEYHIKPPHKGNWHLTGWTQFMSMMSLHLFVFCGLFFKTILPLVILSLAYNRDLDLITTWLRFYSLWLTSFQAYSQHLRTPTLPVPLH